MDIYLDKVHAQRAHDHDKVKKSGRVAMKQMVQHRCYMYQNPPGQDNLHRHIDKCDGCDIDNSTIDSMGTDDGSSSNNSSSSSSSNSSRKHFDS